MNEYYKEIMSLPERGTLADVMKKWDCLYKGRKNINGPILNLLPELFLVGAPGIGKSHLLSLIAGYLNDTKLLEFSGECRFMEFHMYYTPENSHFIELNRFINKLLQVAGYRNEYKGIICIELDEWLDHFREKYFSIFMEYLEEQCRDWLLIFSVNHGEKDKIEKLFSYLSMYFRLEKVELAIPNSKDYLEHLVELLESHSFEVNEEARVVLKESIDELMKNPLFDGYKSINRLGLDITYSKYTVNKFSGKIIGKEDVETFAADGQYIRTMVKNYKKKQQLGFEPGGKEG